MVHSSRGEVGLSVGVVESEITSFLFPRERWEEEEDLALLLWSRRAAAAVPVTVSGVITCAAGGLLVDCIESRFVARAKLSG